MAYEVTATRRRPQKFDDLVGQEFVANTLKNTIKSGRIAHAYLFSGPRGCGKTSSARIMAKSLNCEKGPTAEPCGVCAACREIAKSSCFDVREIDGASNTSVNDVRAIKDEVIFPPQSCRYKIYIIDEVHMLSTSAFNALLKTIEEPPEYVIFIFATTELQKVPATIKSRCQQFNFHLVPIERLKNLLADAAAEIGIKADDEALYWVAKESGGSVRDAYTLFDQVAAFSDGEMSYEKIRDKLGLVGIEQLNNLFEFAAVGDVEKTLTELDTVLQNGITIEQLITNSAQYVRSLMLIKAGVTKEALLGQSADRYSAKVLENWDKVRIERALSLFLNLYRDIRYSLSPRFELDLAFSRLCNLKDAASSGEIKVAIEAARKLLMSCQGGQGVSAYPSQQSNVAQSSFSKNLPQFSALTPHAQPAFVPKVENQPMAAPVQTVPIEKLPVVEQIQPVAELKRKTVEELQYSEALAAGALSEVRFEREGKKIKVFAPNQYQLMQIEIYKAPVLQTLRKVSGESDLELECLVEKEEVKEKVALPKAVEIIRDEFRGTIVGGKI